MKALKFGCNQIGKYRYPKFSATVLSRAAILFPVFAKARENARRSSCNSKLKQIGLGILQYVQGYDEKYPLSRVNDFAVNGTTQNNAPWHLAIQPYVKSAQLFKRPSNTSTGNMFNSPVAIPKSYVCNGTGGGNAAAPGDFGGERLRNIAGTRGGGLALSAIGSTSQVILVSEHPDRADPELYGITDVQFQNHLGMSNFLFCDGHVKSLKPTATGTPINLWSVNNTTNLTDANPGPAPAALLTKLAEQQAKLN